MCIIAQPAHTKGCAMHTPPHPLERALGALFALGLAMLFVLSLVPAPRITATSGGPQIMPPVVTPALPSSNAAAAPSLPAPREPAQQPAIEPSQDPTVEPSVEQAAPAIDTYAPATADVG